MPSARRLCGGIPHSTDGCLLHDIRSSRATFVHIGKLEFRTLCAAGFVDGQASAEVALHVWGLVPFSRSAPRVYAQHGEVATLPLPAMRSRNQVLGCFTAGAIRHAIQFEPRHNV